MVKRKISINWKKSDRRANGVKNGTYVGYLLVFKLILESLGALEKKTDFPNGESSAFMILIQPTFLYVLPMTIHTNVT